MEYMESKMQEQYEAGNAMYAELEKVEAERDALAAQVEALRDALQAVMESKGGGKKFCGHEFDCVCAGDKARAALEATPQHHLRERDAQKGRAGFVAGIRWRDHDHDDFLKYNIDEYADQYADQVRRGEVE